MTVRNISIEAYHKHLESGKALVQWVKIYDHLKEYGAYLTRAEIASRLKMRDSSVCGRVKELLDAEMIVENHRTKCTVTGEQAHTLCINTADPKQGELL